MSISNYPKLKTIPKLLEQNWLTHIFFALRKEQIPGLQHNHSQPLSWRQIAQRHQHLLEIFPRYFVLGDLPPDLQAVGDIIISHIHGDFPYDIVPRIPIVVEHLQNEGLQLQLFVGHREFEMLIEERVGVVAMDGCLPLAGVNLRE